MRRRVFNVATALSLLLCVAAVVLWVRSYWVGDQIQLSHRIDAARYRLLTVASFEGYLDVETQEVVYDSTDPSWIAHHFRVGLFSFRPQGSSIWNRIGFERVESLDPQAFEFIAPLWPLVLFAAVLPCFGILRWIRLARRPSRERCLRCGYDLRATPDRCPECGAEPCHPPHNQPMQRTGAAV